MSARTNAAARCPALCGVVGEPIMQSIEFIGGPIKGRVERALCKAQVVPGPDRNHGQGVARLGDLRAPSITCFRELLS